MILSYSMLITEHATLVQLRFFEGAAPALNAMMIISLIVIIGTPK